MSYLTSAIVLTAVVSTPVTVTTSTTILVRSGCSNSAGRIEVSASCFDRLSLLAERLERLIDLAVLVGIVCGCSRPVADHPGPRKPHGRQAGAADVWQLVVHHRRSVLSACDRHASCGERVAARVVQDPGSEPHRYADGCSALKLSPSSERMPCTRMSSMLGGSNQTLW